MIFRDMPSGSQQRLLFEAFDVSFDECKGFTDVLIQRSDDDISVEVTVAALVLICFGC